MKKIQFFQKNSSDFNKDYENQRFLTLKIEKIWLME